MGVRDALMVRRPGEARPRTEMPDAPPAMPMAMVLTLDQIKPYERNPRRRRNEAYEELKESIRRRGLDVVLHVTRRPGEDLYVVEAGGNTRLRILRELWQETGDERFYRIQVMYRPWRSELHVLAAHIVENDLRAGLCFADRARAIWELKRELERERGERLSLAELQGALAELGVSLPSATLSRMKFFMEFVERLLPEAIKQEMGPHHVQQLQTHASALRRLGRSETDVERMVREAFACGDLHEALGRLESEAEGRASPKEGRSARTEAGSAPEDVSSAKEEAAPRRSAPVEEEAASEDPPTVPTTREGLAEHPDERVRLAQRIMDARAAAAAMAAAAGGLPDDRGFGFRPGEGAPRWLRSLCGEGEVSLSDILERDRDCERMLRLLQCCRQMVADARALESFGCGEWRAILEMTSAEIEGLQEEADEDLRREREQLREFLRLGASNAMIMSLFPGIRPADVVRLRRALGVPANGGRPVKALSFEADRMRVLWRRNAHLPERERWLAVGREMVDDEITLATIWNTLRPELGDA